MQSMDRETEDVMELLARHNSVQQVAALLSVDAGSVQKIYASHYNEVTRRMREYDRREKASELAAMMKSSREKTPEPEPMAAAPEPGTEEKAPEPVKKRREKPREVWGFRDFWECRIYLKVTLKQWPDFLAHFKAQGGNVDFRPFDRSVDRPHRIIGVTHDAGRNVWLWLADEVDANRPVVAMGDLIDAGMIRKKRPQPEVEKHEQTAPEPEVTAEPGSANVAAEIVNETPETVSETPEIVNDAPEPVAETPWWLAPDPGPEEVTPESKVFVTEPVAFKLDHSDHFTHSQTKMRLRPCGYEGESGRVYLVRGQYIEINGMGQCFDREELAILTAELTELNRMIETREVAV